MLCLLYLFFIGKITLFCKGAEVAILDRVVAGDVHTTQRMVDEYAAVSYLQQKFLCRKLIF